MKPPKPPQKFEAEIIGSYVLEHLQKLMNGEHMGHSVVCPIKLEEGPGICRIIIEMPTALGPSPKFGHYTWVPGSKAYVLNDFVYKEKKK